MELLERALTMSLDSGVVMVRSRRRFERSIGFLVVKVRFVFDLAAFNLHVHRVLVLDETRLALERRLENGQIDRIIWSD